MGAAQASAEESRGRTNAPPAPARTPPAIVAAPEPEPEPERLDPELLPPPVSSPRRLISASLTVLNVSAALSACSESWSAICTSFSKSGPFFSSLRS